MADFIFTMDVNAQYESVTQARQQMLLLNREITRATTGPNALDINHASVKEAQMYVKALERAIVRVGQTGENLSDVVADEFKEIRREAGLAGQQTEQLRRELERLNAAGNSGANGVRKVSNAAKVATQEVKRTTSALEKLQSNLREGVGQTLAFGAITAVTGAIGSAVQQAVELDKVMTNISIVSQKAGSEMESYRDSSFEAAKALGTTARDYMDASLIYEQQGGDAAKYAKDLAQATVIASNITGESTQEMSEYLTATINGFEMFETYGAEAGTKVVDVYSRLGAVSGSGLDEMAEALQRTATVAKNAGYSFEEISSAVATVSETTRRSPEVIGSAFKSILLSFQQLREGSEEEMNAFSNKVEKAFDLAGVKGISVFDDEGLRDAKDIMDDIGEKWENISKEGKAAISEAVAGKEQAETFQAFMDNQERYAALLGEAYNSAGTAANQQLIYMDSLQAHVEQFQNAWQKASAAIIDSDMFKNVLGQAERFLTIIGDQENAFMALGTAMAPLVGIFGQLFGGKMVADWRRNIENENLTKNTIKRLEAEGKLTAELEEQLKIATEQQSVVENLGQQAGDAYKKNREELELLREELTESQNIRNNSGANAQEILAQLGPDSSGGVEGINSSKVAAAGQEAIEKAREDMDNLVQKAIEAQQEVENLTSKATDAYSNSAGIANQDASQLRNEMQALSTEFSNFNGESQEISALQQRLNDAVNDTTLTYDQLEQELYEVARAMDELNQAQIDTSDPEALQNYVEQTAQANAQLAEIQAQLAQDTRSPEDIQQEIDLAEAQNAELEAAANRTEKVRKAVELASAAYGSITPVVAAFNSVQEGTITQGEAVQQTFESVGGTLLASMNPYAMAAGGLLTLVGAFGDFRSEAEKVKDANEEVIRSFMSLNETITGQLGGLYEAKDAFEAFQGLDPQKILSGNAIEGDPEKSNKLKEQYKQMAQVVAENSPELVKYYDLEGNAVVDLSAKYENLLADKATDMADNYKLMLNNQKGFLSQYSTEYGDATRKTIESTAELEKAQQTLKEAKVSGDNEAVKDSLKDIQEYTDKIATAKEELSTLSGSINTNLIQPLINSNVELQKLAVTSPELAGKIKNAIADMIPKETIGNYIQSGQEELAETVLANVQEVADVLSSIREPKALEEYNKQLKDMDYLTKQLIFSQKDFDAKELLSGVTPEANDLIRSQIEDFKTATDEAKDYKKELEDLKDAQKELQGWQPASSTTREEAEEKYAKKVDKVRDGLIEQEEKRLRKEAKLHGRTLSDKEAEEEAYARAKKKNSEIFKDDYQDLDKEIKRTTKSIKKQENAFEDLGDQLTQIAKSDEGYNSILEKLEETEDAEKALKKLRKSVKKNQITGEDIFEDGAFKNFEKQFPSIGKEIRDLARKSGKTVDEILAQEDFLYNQTKLYREALAENNADYFNGWKAKNAEAVQYAAANYGIDANNYTTMEQYKAALATANASNFANIEAWKTSLKSQSDDAQKQSEADKHQTINQMTVSSLKGIISGYQYLGDETLTVGQKVVVFFASLADSVLNIKNAILNSFMTAFNWIYKGIGRLVAGAAKLLNKLPGVDIDTDGMVDSTDHFADKISEMGGSKTSNLAGKYAESARKTNMQKQKDAIDMIKFDDDIYKDTQKSIKAPKPLPSATAPDYDAAYDKLNPKEGKKEGRDKDDYKKDKDKDKKKKKKDKKEDVEDLDLELDRYYKLENQMKVIEDHLDNLSAKKEQAYGKDKIKLMEAEQRSYAQQTKTLEKYIQALAKERAEVKKNLSSNGFKFGADGEITNLNTRLKALQKAANSKKGKAKEKAIVDVEELQDAASRYTEIQYDLIPDKKKALAEAKATIKEIEREKVEYKVELHIQKNELLGEIRDTIKEINGEDFTRLDENLAVTSQQIKANIDLYSYYQKKIAEVKKNTKLSDADRQELIQEYKSEALSAVSEAKSAYDELSDIQNEFVSQSGDMIDRVMEQFENIQDKASSLADVYADVYGVRSYEQVGKMRDIQLKAIDEQVTRANQLKLQMELYQATLKEGTDAWNEANDIVTSLGDTIQEQLIARIELLKESFDEFKENLLEYGDRSVFGSLGLEDFEEQMDRVLSKNDKFFSSYEKITQIGGLIAEVNDAIADSMDPQKAADYQKFKEKELQTLMDADQVSADQFERAKLLWDIEQKKQALEDRQNAKRTAQLIRDENGNFTYQYNKADTEESSSAKKDLADAKNSLKEFDEERVRDSASQILDVVRQTKDKINDIYDDTSLSDAERTALLERTMEQAKNDIGELQKDLIMWSGNSMKDGISELETAFSNNQISLQGIGIDDETAGKMFAAIKNGSLQVEDILKNDVDKFGQVLGINTEQSANAISYLLQATGNESTELTNQMLGLSNKWLETTQNNLTTLDNKYYSTQESIKNTTNALETATGNLNAQINQTGESAKKTAAEIEAQRVEMQRMNGVTNNATNAYKKLINQLVGKDGGGGTLGAMVDLQQTMKKKLSPQMVDTTETAEKLRNKSKQTASALKDMGGEANYAYKQHKLFDSKEIRTANDNVKTFGQRADTTANKVESMGNKADSSRKKIASLSVALAALPGLDSGKRYYYTKTNKDGSTESVSYKDKQKETGNLQYVGKFAEGGYTGEWAGSSGNQVGAHAIVHEKEWVLNKDDTKNFLDGMKIQRNLLAKTGGNAESLIRQLGNYNGVPQGNLDQKVEINANFPNVTQSKEIENALSNLSLRAQSHAFNKQNRR